MTMQAVTKTIRLSPEEERVLEQMSREEHLSEAVLLKKLVKEKTMSEVALRALPPSVPREMLNPLLADVRNREAVLQ
jgi:hypothetical protein